MPPLPHASAITHLVETVRGPFTASVANLRGEMGGPDSCDGGWNDCISSLRVSRVD